MAATPMSAPRLFVRTSTPALWATQFALQYHDELVRAETAAAGRDRRHRVRTRLTASETERLAAGFALKISEEATDAIKAEGDALDIRKSCLGNSSNSCLGDSSCKDATSTPKSSSPRPRRTWSPTSIVRPIASLDIQEGLRHTIASVAPGSDCVLKAAAIYAVSRGKSRRHQRIIPL